MDKFPEAFRRLEKQVSLRNVESFKQLTLLISSWAGPKLVYSKRQMDALAVQARRLDIPVQGERERRVQYSHWTSQLTWKYETINVRGKSQQGYRDIKTGCFIKKPSVQETRDISRQWFLRGVQRYLIGNKYSDFSGTRNNLLVFRKKSITDERFGLEIHFYNLCINKF